MLVHSIIFAHSMTNTTLVRRSAILYPPGYKYLKVVRSIVPTVDLQNQK